MRYKMLAAALSAAVSMPIGAASAADLEVMHWWTSGGEQAAVSVFADEFDKLGGDKWVDTAIAGGPQSRAATMQRVLGGDPPGAAQFNPGRQYEELIEGGLLLDLTELAEKEGWKKIIRPESILTNACEKDGKIWCVPVNIHSWQWGWASIPAYQKAGVPVPKNIDEFLASAPKLKEAGITPFAIGGETWQHSGAFNNAMIVSVLGKDNYYKLFRDKDAEYAASPEVAKVFEKWREMTSYTDDASANRNWNDTTALVIQDKAGMQIMGDWARGEFALAGEKPGVDYECIAGPSDHPFLTTDGDIFLFPKQDDPEVEKAQLKLASMMLNPRVQALFNLAKGSLPVRADVDLSLADACMKKGLDLLANPDTVIQATNRFLTEDTSGQINDLIAEFSVNKTLSVADAQKRFADIIRNAK